MKDEKLFDTVIINIDYNDCKEYSNLCSTIMHEMLHAYNEYKSYISNSPIKLKDITNTKSNYYKTLFGGSDTSVSNICKRIINNIRQFEQNAYLSELSAVLDTHKFNIANVSKPTKFVFAVGYTEDYSEPMVLLILPYKEIKGKQSISISVDKLEDSKWNQWVYKVFNSSQVELYSESIRAKFNLI